MGIQKRSFNEHPNTCFKEWLKNKHSFTVKSRSAKKKLTYIFPARLQFTFSDFRNMIRIGIFFVFFYTKLGKLSLYNLITYICQAISRISDFRVFSKHFWNMTRIGNFSCSIIQIWENSHCITKSRKTKISNIWFIQLLLYFIHMHILKFGIQNYNLL